MTAKITPLKQAIEAFVEPGMSLYFACAHTRPTAATMEVCRRFRGMDPGFEVGARGFVAPMHALVHLGLASRIVTSFVGEIYPRPQPNPTYSRGVATGLEIEHWSLLTLVQRLLAGACGLPWITTRSLVGSSMAADLSRAGKAMPGPDGTLLVRALTPDIAFVHAAAADEHGNALVPPPYGEGVYAALAARVGAIVTAERIVSTSRLRTNSQDVLLPGFKVLSVSEVPFGAHPWGMSHGLPDLPAYADDYAFIEGAAVAARAPKTLDGWLDDWVLTGSHETYLDRLGEARLRELEARARVVPGETRPTDPGHEPPTQIEAMATAAAEVVAERAQRGGHDRLLAGIGIGNLAAWLAARILAERGVDIALIAEIGMFGYEPALGDPFIFSAANIPSAVHLSDVLGILGSLLGPTRADNGGTLGVLGAAEIDPAGNVNSTLSGGALLVGSGGANDVASAAAEVVVCIEHGRDRLVPEVEYVTSPGLRVRAVVTTRAVFEREGEAEPFRLTRVVGAGPATIPGSDTVREILATCGWEVETARELGSLRPDPQLLGLLRAFDPQGHFTGRRSAPGSS